MAHRLNAESLRSAASALGDRTDLSIAKRAGLPRATLSRLVNGHVEPTLTNLVRLASCYGLTIESLIREADAAQPIAA
jgi:transcriptional regulator with XRE-family HTH domain